MKWIEAHEVGVDGRIGACAKKFSKPSRFCEGFFIDGNVNYAYFVGRLC
jgi:hypothetical protein